MPPTMTTTSALTRNAWSCPGASDSAVPAKTPPRPASAEPTKKAAAKTRWTLTPSADVICGVVDAGADHHADPGPLVDQPEQQADEDRGAQDRDAERRVGEVVDAERQRLGQELRRHDRRRRAPRSRPASGRRGSATRRW